ncbi:asparaginase [Thiomicrospira microaerophila]|uniref:asparaginase domain-containing protein n=1 Tax=Thiomicrospira microaerophila TaxID=406020 RepID=UPI00200E6DE7|nr:asparaginase domain-containing protein [Thiomicrospira microaerophila]UQB41329.1 asparaginase [Thiomicrospira microaerophila]
MKPTSSSIALLACGGTLDKDYNPLTGELVFSQSCLAEMLQQANHQLNIRLETLMLKDSLEMTEQDRETLYQACLTSTESAIIVTHGTDTMTDSAEYLLARTEHLKTKTIVLTGAMRPFKLSQSDAMFNLGSACLAVQLAQPGIYITMNGQLFTAGQVKKNRQLGIFSD